MLPIIASFCLIPKSSTTIKAVTLDENHYEMPQTVPENHFLVEFQTTKSGINDSGPSFLVEQHSKEDYVKAWQKIKQQITNDYYDRKKRKDDIKTFLSDAETKVLAASNDAEFREAVEAMIHRFGDSHFDIWMLHDQEYYVFDALARGDKAKDMPSIGAYFVPCSVNYGGKLSTAWKVDMVLNGSEAESKGLREGDIVLEANDQPFAPIDSFAANIGKDVELKVLRPAEIKSLESTDSLESGSNFTEMDVKVSPSSHNALDEFLTATQNSEKVIDYNGKKFGYIHVWTLTNSKFSGTLQSAVLNRLYNTDGLIFDIRGGFGGRPENILSTFFVPPIDLGWSSPSFKYVEHTGYSKPIVLLTDSIARSAKEVVSEMFKESKRATLVGQTTAGNVLGTTPMRINDWLYLELPIVDVTVSGHRLEKVGVKPNVFAPLGFDSKGQDLTVLKGEQVLFNLVTHKPVNAAH